MKVTPWIGLLAVGGIGCSEPSPSGAPAGTPGASPHEVTNTLGMRFLWVEAGRFEMGSPPGEAGADLDEARHAAQVARPFYLGATEVTQAQWRALMPEHTSHFAGDARPVDSVSWEDARTFARLLSEREGVTYRLPSEVEWERACRAGTQTAFGTGEVLAPKDALVRPPGSDGSAGLRAAPATTAEIASYPENRWGFHDLHGNVWEWVEDSYQPYDGPARPAETRRVLRGGAWNFPADAARCASRMAMLPTRRYDCNGVRLVRETAPSPSQE